MEVFRTDISASDIEASLCLLNEEERVKAGRLGGSLKRRFIVSRAFRRRVLGQGAEILTEENGRPYIKGNPFFFSMSHSGDIVVLAVDGHPIGIDIEFMKERNYAKLSARFFGERIPGREGFYGRWTRFEAGLKLAGLPLFSKAAPEPAYMHSEIIGGYMLSVASGHGIGLPLSIKTL